MKYLDKKLIETLDSYSFDEDIVKWVTRLEDEFDVNDLLALSDAVCQAGACKELAFAVLPFMLRLSEDVSEENKLHLFVESAMIYAYSYEIEDKIPDNLMCCLKETVSKYRNKILEYYLANSFELTDEYYLVAAIMTFYNQKWGASILYGDLFPYESEIELDCCCPNLHDIVLYVNDDGICCLGEQPATNRSASNVMELSSKEDKSNIQELLDVINKVLADKGLHTLKQFEEISESEAGVVFIVMGTMLMYAGYNEQAKRYYYMLNSIECPVCHQKFIPAEQWGALKMNVHDSMVVRYSADLENETFAMYLKPDTEEGVKEVNFEGVLAHWFEYVASWNVLYDIEELDVKTFISYFKKVLLEGKSDGWPLFFETLEDLEEQLLNKGYKTYYISGCCGITGFVIAEQVSVKV